MEGLSHKTAVYPGCSLEGTSSGYQASLEKVLSLFDQKVPEVENWSCCGASSAHALDHDLNTALSVRNLALAESQDYDTVLAPCASCYNRLASAQFEISKDAQALAQANQQAQTSYRGSIRVVNAIEYLYKTIGVERIAQKTQGLLNGMRAVCYYGCLNTRIPRMQISEDREYPMWMDYLTRAAGCEVLDWSYKTTCCGASLFVSAPETSERLISRILQDAAANQAEMIVVACPMCQTNLDAKQDAIRAQCGIASPIPVVYITQVIGLACGLGPNQLGMRQNMVPFPQLAKANT